MIQASAVGRNEETIRREGDKRKEERRKLEERKTKKITEKTLLFIIYGYIIRT